MTLQFASVSDKTMCLNECSNKGECVVDAG